MLPEVATTGFSVLGDLPWGTHFGYFYETKQDLVEASIAFFQAGLENNEVCLWLIQPPVSEADALSALRHTIPDADRHIADGRLQIVNHPQPRFEGDIPEPRECVTDLQEKHDEALARGFAGLRVAGSPTGMQKVSPDRFRQFEFELGRSVAGQRIIALCYFPTADSTAAEMLDAARSHRFLLTRHEAEWKILETPEGRRTNAEMARLNEELERRVEERTQALEELNEKLRKEIARREQVEEDLRRQKEILQTIFEHVPVMLKFADKDGQIQMLNREWSRVLGYSLDDINQGHVYEVCYPDPIERRRAIDFVENSNGEWMDFKTTTKDGRVIDTTWATARLSDGARICICQDISQRKRVEEDLRKQKEIFQRIFDNIPVMINFGETQFGLQLANREWERTLGWTMEEIERDKIDILAENYPDPEYREQVRNFVLNTNGEWRDFKTRVRDGRVVDTSWAMLRFPDGTSMGIGRDITLRKKAEEEVSRQKEILQTIFDNIPVMVTFGRDSELQLVNREWERITGWTIEEVRQNNVDIVAEAFPDPEAQKQARKFRTQTDGEWTEFKTRVRDGRFIDTSWMTVHLPDGSWMAIGQDITARKRAEGALRESEERFRQLAENITDLFWIKTPDFKRVLYLSPAYENFSGIPRQQRYQDLDPEPFLARIHPEDREKMTEIINRDPGSQFDVEFRIFRADGTMRWIRDRGFPVRDEYGQIYRIAGIANDITDRKLGEQALRESEERFRQLAENINEVFWLRSPDFKQLLYVSPVYGKVCGKPPEVIYATAMDLEIVHPDDRDRVSQTMQNAGDQEFEIEYRIITHEGQIRWLRDRGFPIRNEQGQIYRFGGVAEDITERKKAEESIATSREQLRALSASLQSAREQEATRISHQIHDDLGGILTSLRWELEALDKSIQEPGDLTAQKPSMANRLKTMVGLTDTTIDTVRRIASELRPSILDDLGLPEALEWQAEQFQNRTGILCECDWSLETVSLSDQQSTTLFRIVQEALTNILRHAQATAVSITITKGNEFLELKISDNGRGITHAEMFNRASLGLLGMRERARLIGAQIAIIGVSGGGTIVQVLVPLTEQMLAGGAA